MERKIILYIAQTLDGYIATKDQKVDFLDDYGKDTEDYGYQEFIKSTDTVIMGRKTYDFVQASDGSFPYENEMTYVLSRSAHKSNTPNIKFVKNVDDILIDLSDVGRDIFLIGGGEIIKLFMDRNLIDEIHLTIIHKTIGDGIRLFNSHHLMHTYKRNEVFSYDDGLVQIIYKK